jgi:DNA-binding transcriptional ArsR family regulator
MLRKHNRQVAEVFFALGDETRLSVLAKLRTGALSATALADGAAVTRQAIVRHLNVLDGAGLVTHERRGREVLYLPDSRRLEEARAYLEMISAGWDRAIDRLKDMVEEQSQATAKKRRQPQSRA